MGSPAAEHAAALAEEMSGIRAEVAQAMVRLDIEMSSIVTMGTLQSGIAYALRRCGPSPELGAQERSARSPLPGPR